MTANQIFAPVQALPCTHTSIIPGLDCLQCKSCRRTWPSWHQDFNRLLNQVAPEQNFVLEQDNSVLEQDNSVLEQINNKSEKSAPEQKQWLETYSPSTKKAYSYYRYVWMDGRRLHHVHISGGNTKSAIALCRKSEVERWIALGRDPFKICALIKSWGKRT